jgi:hypothetical protein
MDTARHNEARELDRSVRSRIVNCSELINKGNLDRQAAKPLRRDVHLS